MGDDQRIFRLQPFLHLSSVKFQEEFPLITVVAASKDESRRESWKQKATDQRYNPITL